MAPTTFTRETLRHAFDALGQELARQQVFVELAVYGGSAIVLQFEWRSGTIDIDATVRPGSEEHVLKPAVEAVARQFGYDDDWLNNAVGMFTPEREDEALFLASGVYPLEGDPALRVLLARPHYLLAMKLQALASLDRGDRDMTDARGLAAHLGIESEDELAELYRSIFDENPPVDVARRLPGVLA